MWVSEPEPEPEPEPELEVDLGLYPSSLDKKAQLKISLDQKLLLDSFIIPYYQKSN